MYFGYRALVAAALALPLAYAVGVVMGGHPDGDARLFEPGGMVLLDVLERLEGTLPALTMQAALVTTVAAFVGLAPLLGLMVAMASEPDVGARRILRRVVSLFGTFALVHGLASAATVGLGALSVGLVDTALGRVAWSGPENRDVAHAGALALGAFVAMILGVLHDVARAIVVRRGYGLYDTLACTLRLAKKRGWVAVLLYAARAVPATAVLALALFGTARMPRVSTSAIASTLVVGQGALLVVVALRASWLAAAMRLVDRFLDDETRAWQAEQQLEVGRGPTSGETPGALPSPPRTSLDTSP